MKTFNQIYRAYMNGQNETKAALDESFIRRYGFKTACLVDAMAAREHAIKRLDVHGRLNMRTGVMKTDNQYWLKNRVSYTKMLRGMSRVLR